MIENANLLPAICRLRAETCDKRFNDLDRILMGQILSAKEAVENAKIEMNRRLASMNEFREQLEKKDDESVKKEFYEREQINIINQIMELKEWKAQMSGIMLEKNKLELSSGARIGMVIGFFALLVSAFTGVIQLLHLVK